MKGLTVARVRGVPVHVEPAWGVVLAVAGSAMFLRITWDGTPPGVAAAVAGVGALLLLAGVLVHEIGHAVAARRVGVEVRGVSLVLLGGYTEVLGEPDRPAADLAVAAAGPVATLALAAALGGARSALAGPLPGAADVAGLLAVVNLAAAGVNLLPGLPLDGGRILRALHWLVSGDRAAAERFAAGVGRVLGSALIAGGIAVAVVWRSVIPLVAAGVGWFVHAGSLAAARTAGALATPVAAVMAAALPAVPPDSIVEPAGVAVPVAAGGRVVGLVAPGRRGRAGDVMVLIEPDDVVDCGVPLGEAAARTRRTGRPLVVVEAGRMVGVVAPATIGEWARRREDD